MKAIALLTGILIAAAMAAQDFPASSNARRLMGRNICSTAPSDAEALKWNAASNCWEPGAAASSSFGFGVTRTSSTVLTIEAGTARIGATVYPIAAATATISAGSDAAYIYVDANGDLIVGHDSDTIVCDGCTEQSGITGFPNDSLPIYTWSATAGTWDNAGGVDQRAALSRQSISGGSGVTVTESATGIQIIASVGSQPSSASLHLVEEFCFGGTAADATYAPIGGLGWRATVTAVTAVAPTAGHPCVRSLPSAASSGNALISGPSTGASVGEILNLAGHSDWEIEWVFRLTAAPDGTFAIGVGHSTGSLSDNNLAVIEWNSSDATTNLIFRTRDNGGTAVDVDTGVAASNTDWHRLLIRSVASAVTWCLDACSSPAAVTFPDGNSGDWQLVPFVRAAHVSNAYAVHLDYFRLTITSTITRY